jgi:hypothetical protein
MLFWGPVDLKIPNFTELCSVVLEKKYAKHKTPTMNPISAKLGYQFHSLLIRLFPFYALTQICTAFKILPALNDNMLTTTFK